MADSMDKKYSNVPILRFPEFNDEWKLTSYNLLFEFQNGINGSPEKYGKGIKYISVMDILNNQYITYSNIKGLIDATEKEQQNFMVGYGDVLFQRSSETPEDAGKSNVYLDSKPCVFGGFVIRGKKIGNYNPIFIKYALASNANRKKMIRLGAGAQHINIGQNNLNSLKISLPSEFEQEKIALLFDAIDKKIETQNKIIRDLETHKRFLLKEIFNTKKPNSTIGDYLKEYTKKNVNNYEPVAVGKNGIRKRSEIFSRELSEDYTKNKVIELDSLIIGMGTKQIDIAILHENKNFCVSPAYSTFKVCNIDPYYFENLLKSMNYLLSLRYMISGARQGKSVNKKELLLHKIFVHAKEEQIQLSSLLRFVDKRIDTETQILEKYYLQKEYLLNSLFI